MYYNNNSGGIGNTLPFGSLGAAGYKCQWLIGANEFNLPNPAPPGNAITKFYIWISATGSGTYTNLTIKLGQTSQTVLPPGAMYTGQLDTVYFRASGTLSGTLNNWMMITLDREFVYDPTQSLVIDIGQCGLSGSGFNVWQTAGVTGVFRRNPIPGNTSCVFTYSGQDSRILQCGIDVAPPTGSTGNNQNPVSFFLEQNYPNPFNPVTEIKFGIPVQGNVKLTVTDMLGKQVAELLNEHRNAGVYSVNFDASSLSSGIYFYTVISGEFKDTKKMVMIK
jgi:hypothetical protein